MRALYVRHALVGYLLPRSLCLQPLFTPLAGCTHLNGCGGVQLPCNVCQNSVSAFAYTCHVRNLTRIIEGSYMQTCYVVKRYVSNHILLPLTAYYLLQSVCFPVPTLFGLGYVPDYIQGSEASYTQLSRGRCTILFRENPVPLDKKRPLVTQLSRGRCTILFRDPVPLTRKDLLSHSSPVEDVPSFSETPVPLTGKDLLSHSSPVEDVPSFSETPVPLTGKDLLSHSSPVEDAPSFPETLVRQEQTSFHTALP